MRTRRLAARGGTAGLAAALAMALGACGVGGAGAQPPKGASASASMSVVKAGGVPKPGPFAHTLPELRRALARAGIPVRPAGRASDLGSLPMPTNLAALVGPQRTRFTVLVYRDPQTGLRARESIPVGSRDVVLRHNLVVVFDTAPTVETRRIGAVVSDLGQGPG